MAVLLLAGCTNSKLIISPLYNRLDDRMYKEFEKLAQWDESQTAQFETSLATYHVWHRQSELPKYANLMQSVTASLAGNERASRETVSQWFTDAESYTQAVRECHPINYLFDMTKTLADNQIDFIEARFKRERVKNREKHFGKTPSERVESRLKSISKWTARIGFEFNAGQRAMVRTALVKQISLRRQYYQLSDAWNQTFFQLARNQQAPDYDARMQRHLTKLWSLLETGHPDEWQQNRKLWRDLAYRLAQSMTTEQRRDTRRWLSKMASTLDAIARDKPDQPASKDPSVGCLVTPL